MKLSIQLFAGLSDTLGTSQINITLQEEAITVITLKHKLKELYPQLAGQLEASFIAVNQAYAAPEDEISEQDEIAIIPPVSGG
jgi:molybdopterin synthase catalytic subunit